MKNKYQMQLGQVLSGDSKSVAEDMFRRRGDDFRSEDAELERKLLSYRLALKSGSLDSSIELLRPEQTGNAYLKAELLFVKGTYFAHMSEHAKAATQYAAASDIYASLQVRDRQALSQYNSLIARTYGGAVDDSTWRDLADFCQQHNISNVRFLCDRHRSFEFYQKKLYEDAIRAVIAWTAKSDAISKSDSELALLHIADCFLELKDLRKALLYFDQVNEPFDERVRFPKALIEAKIFGKSMNVSDYAVVSDHWRARYKAASLQGRESAPRATNELRWHPATGLISKGRRMFATIKTQSLEGRLLQLVVAGSKTKAQLAEALWPESLDGAYLNDRFHQLLRRIERKIPGLIVYDGQAYRLGKELRIR